MSTLTTQTKVLTNKALKGILSDALVERGVAVDVDAITTPGVYYINQTTANTPLAPGSYGILIVARTGDLMVQLAWLWRTGLPILQRMKSSTVTQPWSQIPTTPIS